MEKINSDTDSKDVNHQEGNNTGSVSKIFKGVASIAAAGALMFSSHDSAVENRGDKAETESLASVRGIDFAKLEKFSPVLEVEAPEGRPYIVVIGQLHYVDGLEDRELISGVIESQKKIESILRTISQSEGKKIKVYKEGNVSSIGQDLVVTVGQVLDSIKPGPEVFEKIVSVHQKVSQKRKAQDDSLDTFVVYQFKKRVQSLAEFYRQNPAEFRQTIHYKNVDEAISWSDYNISSYLDHKFGPDSYYLYGAVYKLADEGVVQVLPAETKESNNAMVGILRDSEERVSELREDKTIEIVAGDEGGDANVRFLVYGRDHLFINNVKKFNRDNPDRAVGLITIDASSY